MRKNMLGKKLQVCSLNPMTGYYRDGYCMTGKDDTGTHSVCGIMDPEFLKYTASKGNDLSSVVKPGDKWCLCENRWLEAYRDNKSPLVDMKATNMRTRRSIRKKIKRQSKKKNRSNRLYYF